MEVMQKTLWTHYARAYNARVEKALHVPSPQTNPVRQKLRAIEELAKVGKMPDLRYGKVMPLVTLKQST